MGFRIGREHGAGRGTVVKKGKHIMRSKEIAAPGSQKRCCKTDPPPGGCLTSSRNDGL